MNFKVIGIGEVLWDLLPSGPQLGGAPLNFAYHAKQLGAQAQVITRVGNDEYGRQILQRFDDMGIDADTVQVDGQLPTGTAGIVLEKDGTPQFILNHNVAWDGLSLNDRALEAVQKTNAICFGTLAQRNPPAALAIQSLVAAAPAMSLKVFDINLRQGFYTQGVIERSLEMANVVKLNDQELMILAKIFALRGDERHQIEQLAEHHGFQLVALTRGGKGSALFQAGQWSELAGGLVKVADTVGAGDSFTAALVMGLLNGMNLEDMHRIAADIANFVCTRPGATPVLPEDLCSAFALHCKHV